MSDEIDPSEDRADSPDQEVLLDHIVDDLGPRQEAEAWLRAQMLKGQTPEALSAELLEQGWAIDDVEVMVEDARRDTRRERGVITREDVVHEANKRYRMTSGARWFAAFPVVSSGVRLLYSLGTVLGLKRKRPGTK